MPFAGQTFVFNQVLTSTELQQTDTNIDEVRRSHKNSVQPPETVAGILWLDDSSGKWEWKIARDGSNFNSLIVVDPSAAFALPRPHVALVSRSSNQTITTALTTTMIWQTENQDTDGFWSPAPNPTRLTVPSGLTGTYYARLTANIEFAVNGTGDRDILIGKNGAAFLGNPRLRIRAPANANARLNIVSPILSVVANDFFEVFVFQDSGGNLDVLTGNSTWFNIDLLYATP